MPEYEKQDLLHKSDEAEIWIAADGDKQVIERIFHRKSGLMEIYRGLLNFRQQNLPEILDLWENETGFTVIEEYIEGVPVSDLIMGGKPFTEKECRSYALQLCAALKALHKKQIVHRDIKPENIMITESGMLKLIDLGAARFYNVYSEKDTRFLGTQGYAAPEQYGFSQTDFRTDLYALGVTIQNMAGQKGSRGFQKILAKCTRLDPNQRYQSVDEVINALRNVYLKRILGAAVLLLCFCAAVSFWPLEENRLYGKAPLTSSDRSASEPSSPPDSNPDPAEAEGQSKPSSPYAVTGESPPPQPAASSSSPIETSGTGQAAGLSNGSNTAGPETASKDDSLQRDSAAEQIESLADTAEAFEKPHDTQNQARPLWTVSTIARAEELHSMAASHDTVYYTEGWMIASTAGESFSMVEAAADAGFVIDSTGTLTYNHYDNSIYLLTSYQRSYDLLIFKIAGEKLVPVFDAREVSGLSSMSQTYRDREQGGFFTNGNFAYLLPGKKIAVMDFANGTATVLPAPEGASSVKVINNQLYANSYDDIIILNLNGEPVSQMSLSDPDAMDWYGIKVGAAEDGLIYYSNQDHAFHQQIGQEDEILAAVKGESRLPWYINFNSSDGSIIYYDTISKEIQRLRKDGSQQD